MYESEATTGYSHYYRRYPEVPVFSSTSAEASTDFSSEEMRHIYEHSELTKEVCECVCEREKETRCFGQIFTGNISLLKVLKYLLSTLYILLIFLAVFAHLVSKQK